MAMFRDLTDDAETEVGLILEFRAFDRGELAAFAHRDVHETFSVTKEMRPAEVSRQSDRHAAHGKRNSGTNTERSDLEVVLDFIGLEAVTDRVVNHGIRFDAAQVKPTYGETFATLRSKLYVPSTKP